jgi:predicted nuclease of predicted toxin-antitoxin system
MAGSGIRFFFDNNLSPNLAKGLHSFGENVEHLRDNFDPDTEDEIWLKYAGENGLVVITRDGRIKKNPAEIKAYVDHKVGAFFIVGKNLKKCEIIQLVIKAWPNIKETAHKTRPPYAFKVKRQGGRPERLIIK